MHLSQVEFARRLGRSYASIQGYEAGKRISTDVRDRLIAMATEHGYQDLVEDFISDRDAEAAAEIAASRPQPALDPARVRAISSERRITDMERKIEAIMRLIESAAAQNIGARPEPPGLARIEAILRSIEQRLAALEGGAPPRLPRTGTELHNDDDT